MGKESFVISLILFNIIFLLLLAAIVVFIVQYRKKKKSHTQELEYQSESHHKELLQTKLEVQDNITQHLGREIHDNVGQKLTLASIYLQQHKSESNEKEASKIMDDVKELINGSLSELRSLSKTLTNDAIKKSSITDLIKEEVERADKIEGVSIFFTADKNIVVNSYQAKIVLLRVTQEFIQNSLKHAKCNNITIAMNDMQNDIQVVLSDDGVGFNVEGPKANGIGLKNIKKRIAILKGELTLSSKDPIGTQMILRIPKV